MKINHGQIFKDFVELEGYKLLSVYKNNSTKVSLMCPNDHIFEMRPNNFKSGGQRCPKCSGKCTVQAKEQFEFLIKQEGYVLLSEYKKALSKVRLKCPEGHGYEVRPNDFKMGHRCPKCDGQCPIQAKGQFMDLLRQEGYELVSKYKKSNEKISVLCPEGHEWDVRPDDFKNRYIRCPHCNGSTGQRKLQELLRGMVHEEVIYNDRVTLNGLELDIYYPELKVAIEYQGNYWHSLPKTIDNDRRKKDLCKGLDINLIEVWDNDFMKNNELIIQQVIEQMGVL